MCFAPKANEVKADRDGVHCTPPACPQHPVGALQAISRGHGQGDERATHLDGCLLSIAFIWDLSDPYMMPGARDMPLKPPKHTPLVGCCHPKTSTPKGLRGV